MNKNNCGANIEGPSEDIPQWQKDFIDERLKAIENNPDSIKDIEDLFEELDKRDRINYRASKSTTTRSVRG